MNTLISFLLMTAVIGQTALAHILPGQVTSARGFAIALSANEKIQNYVRGRTPATADLFVEILRFILEVDNSPGVNDKANELLDVAEEVARQLPSLDRDTRAELKPIMNALLVKYAVKVKSGIMTRLFNRFWMWSPDNLDYMARLVRNDRPGEISTQLIWVLEQATPEERKKYFSQVPGRSVNAVLRWFPLALEYKYGQPVNMRDLKRSLRAVNPDKVRPDARPFKLNGVVLATTADLYNETKARLAANPQEEVCAEIVVAGSSSSSGPI